MLLGIVDRATEDLDFFATAPTLVDRLAPAVERALTGQGLDVRARRIVPGFVRYEVSDGSDVTGLDLSWDIRLSPTQSSEVGAVLATDEPAADKTLALFGRAEPRDFVDVFSLRTAYTRDDLLRLAGEKDAGFRLDRFAEAIDRIDRVERRDFPVDDQRYEQLRREFADWRHDLVIEPGPKWDIWRREPPSEPPGLDLGL